MCTDAFRNDRGQWYFQRFAGTGDYGIRRRPADKFEGITAKRSRVYLADGWFWERLFFFEYSFGDSVWCHQIGQKVYGEYDGIGKRQDDTGTGSFDGR